jgi:photosystem II stability/assembly factor-like uncharacterized protein
VPVFAAMKPGGSHKLQQKARSTASESATMTWASAAFQQLPLAFEANHGQIDGEGDTYLFKITSERGEGFQWQLQTLLSGNLGLASVKAVSQEVAWTCGSQRVYRTIDGGRNWILTATATTSEELACMEALNATTAFVGGGGPGYAGGDAKIYRTTNGGQSWEVVYTATGPASYWDGIHFFDGQNGIALSDPPAGGATAYLIVKTTDGGTTWTPIANPPSANENEFGVFNSFYFYDNLHGWFGTGDPVQLATGGRVFRTIDGGNTWTGFASGNTTFVFGVCFISPMVGIRTSSFPPFLARSIDGGQTWAPVDNLPVADIQGLFPATVVNTASLHQLWVQGDAGPNRAQFFLTSIDGGVTWQEQSASDLSGGLVNHMSAASFGASSDSVQAWAVTSIPGADTLLGGHILSYRDRIGITTSVQERHSHLPAAFALLQNYPNPFNPTTKIAFRIAELGWVSLKVYDVMGREVATLVNEKKQPGNYEINFDASGLKSGVYFYKMRAGDFVEARKFVALK